MNNFSLNRIDILKVMTHPVRLKILEELLKGVKCVSDFKDFLEVSQSNISQHLILLRRYELVDYYVDGRLKCYFLRDPIIPDLLELLRREYEDDLPAPDCCPVTKKGKYHGSSRR